MWGVGAITRGIMRGNLVGGGGREVTGVEGRSVVKRKEREEERKIK